MSEMSNQNSENNVNRAGPVGEGSSPGRFDSGDPVVILLLLEQSGVRM